MTEEKLNVVEVADDTQKCNCPICKFLRSDDLKKFLAVVLASFIGCSIALLVFAPKKHHPGPRPIPPYERMMDRPMPPIPHQDFRNYNNPTPYDYRGEHRMPPRDYRGHHNDGIKKHYQKLTNKWQNKHRDLKSPDRPTPEPQPVKAE